MTNSFTVRAEVPPGGRWRWPVWAGYAACGWAALTAAPLTIALDGGSLFGLPHGAWWPRPSCLPPRSPRPPPSARGGGGFRVVWCRSAAVWTAAALALGSSAPSCF